MKIFPRPCYPFELMISCLFFTPCHCCFRWLLLAQVSNNILPSNFRCHCLTETSLVLVIISFPKAFSVHSRLLEALLFLYSFLFFNPHPRTCSLILERGEGRERNTDWLTLECALTRGGTGTPDMSSDQKSTCGPLGLPYLPWLFLHSWNSSLLPLSYCTSPNLSHFSKFHLA